MAADDMAAEFVAGVILAGGKNSRMGGHDKAFLRLNGEPVFARTLALMRRCFPHVIVVSNTPEKYAGFAVEVVKDELPGLGPLGGLHAALGHVRQPYVFVVACDMPFLSRPLLVELIARADQQDVVIPLLDGRPEPMHAVYRRLASLQAIRAALAAGERRMISFLDRVRVARVEAAELKRWDPELRSFFNTNTPADLEQARAIAAGS